MELNKELSNEKNKDQLDNNFPNDWYNIMNLMMPFVSGHLHSRMVDILTKFNVCDIIEEGPKTVKQVADRIGMNEDACNRFLRFFVAHGVFKEDKNNLGTFEKTNFSTMISEKSGNKCLVKLLTNNHQYKMFETLIETFFTKKNTGPSSIGLYSFWDLFQDQEYNESFCQSMTLFTKGTISYIINSNEIDFSKYDQIVDIGGNQGSFVGSLLQHYPSVKSGINFDSSVVINSNLEDKFKHDKLKNVSGDFFIQVPESDCYVIKHILHDWTNEDCIKILKTISKSMKPNAEIYIFDLIINPEKNYSMYEVYFDISMFQLFNARERTLNEWKQLFELADFNLERVIDDIKTGCMVITKK